MKLHLFAQAAALAATALLASTSHAYFSVIDTGDILTPGKYQMSLEPQLILQDYDGFNAVARFDRGINEESSARAILGFGKVDFQVGGFYKWVPFPDTGNQPAIGGSAGAILARVNGDTQFSVRVNPLVSKRFETEIGDLTPYASLPLGVTSRKDETVVPVQLALGSELQPINNQNLSVFAELGFNLNKAFGYISAAIAYRFDEPATR
jgi:hypothetical protein